ncbi:YbjN domain-containing protein [Candidatus Poriferisocius sp.]|uniref:YbjN domain-containing protein n=1 Tax=Candidatus Poriferisocius sp. TaxID=3101276 RepID=UPI003B01B751
MTQHLGRGSEGAPLSVGELAGLEADIDAWLDDQLRTNPSVLTVDRGEPGHRRWYVRMVGEEKAVSTVWFTLGQRLLHCECHFMPAPEENEGRLYEYLLRRNRELTGLRFAIGIEDAVFLVAELPVHAVTEVEVDRLLGSFYAYGERWFRSCMRIGYETIFKK